jgi:hypothetical protein
MNPMKHHALLLCLVATPLWAETPAPAPIPPTPEVEEGFSLMEEGAKLLLKGLMADMEPTLDEMGKALSELEPALKDLQPKMLELLALVDDLTHYLPPERLPNGDIVIRRAPGAPLPPPLPQGPAPTGPAPLPQTDL